MRRLWILGSLLVLALALAALAGPRLLAAAQEGTPVVTEGAMGEGFTYEQIAFGTVDVLPPAPADINFFRIRMAPGVSLPIGAEDPGLGPQLVEAGTLTVRGFTEEIVDRRVGGGEGAVPAGGEAELGAGESFVWEPYVGGEIANEGDEPVVLLTVNIFPVGAATPAAGGMATPEM